MEEIQRTGDIFFPKRWVDATLGGHRSSAAAGVVQRFVDQIAEDYPDRLRRIILSAADGLFRASRLTPAQTVKIASALSARRAARPED